MRRRAVVKNCRRLLPQAHAAVGARAVRETDWRARVNLGRLSYRRVTARVNRLSLGYAYMYALSICISLSLFLSPSLFLSASSFHTLHRRAEHVFPRARRALREFGGMNVFVYIYVHASKRRTFRVSGMPWRMAPTAERDTRAYNTRAACKTFWVTEECSRV